MNRITFEGLFCDIAQCVGQPGNTSECTGGYCDQRRTWERLKEYEDTGLMPEQVTEQRWIPVTERLPEDEKLVLILCKNGARFVGFCGKQYADFERRWRIKTALNSTKLLNVGRVTHWMPLPEPPKEVSKDA